MARAETGGVGGAREQRGRAMSVAAAFRDYQHCPTAHELAGAEWPPTICLTRAPPKPLRLLFVGVIPPPGGRFGPDDNDPLLKKVRWVFTRMTWAKTSGNADLRTEFQRAARYVARRFAFAHRAAAAFFASARRCCGVIASKRALAPRPAAAFPPLAPSCRRYSRTAGGVFLFVTERILSPRLDASSRYWHSPLTSRTRRDRAVNQR